MSEHPTQFRLFRYAVLEDQADYEGKAWFIFDTIVFPAQSLPHVYTNKAEAEAVCKLLNAAEGE
jgi:hypothetical protein